MIWRLLSAELEIHEKASPGEIWRSSHSRSPARPQQHPLILVEAVAVGQVFSLTLSHSLSPPLESEIKRASLEGVSQRGRSKKRPY
jgi:hypothetical protein